MSAYGIAQASLDVPLTQQTAPVLEHRCLYTSDRHKKQKKWHDGRLKYHTFNKKVIVWDDRSHLIGETYWREDDELEDGAELILERNGTLVEVGECVGRTETDLSDLVGKRVKEREERAIASAYGTPTRYPPANHGTPAGLNDLRPKPLNAVLTPTGHYGRALMPIISPYEQKQQDRENEPPAKRRKQASPPSKSGYAANLTGTQIVLNSSRSRSTAPIRYEPLKVSVRQTPSTRIDVTGDDGEQDAGEYGRGGAGQRPNKIPKRARPSPKAKSGYASNLTGASLSLSRPEITLQRPKQIRAKPVSTINSNLLLDPSSSSAPRDSSEVGMSEERPRLKTKEPPAKKQPKMVTPNISSPVGGHDSSDVEKSLSDQRPRNKNEHQLPKAKPMRASFNISSSPVVEEDRTLAPRKPPKTKIPDSSIDTPTVPKCNTAKTTIPESSALDPTPAPRRKIQKSTVPNSSTLDPTPDRPVTALRIKSRPRRTMMFLDRPGSRPSLPTEGSISGRPVQKPPDNNSGAPEPSQATKLLNEFCEKQKEAVQARLKKMRPLASAEDCPTSLSPIKGDGSNVSKPSPKPVDDPLRKRVPSQGTKELMEFCEMQKEAVQERLSTKGPVVSSPKLPSPSVDDNINDRLPPKPHLSSQQTATGMEDSPTFQFDIGIDHQTIDRLLTRKSGKGDNVVGNIRHRGRSSDAPKTEEMTVARVAVHPHAAQSADDFTIKPSVNGSGDVQGVTREAPQRSNTYRPQDDFPESTSTKPVTTEHDVPNQLEKQVAQEEYPVITKVSQMQLDRQARDSTLPKTRDLLAGNATKANSAHAEVPTISTKEAPNRQTPEGFDHTDKPNKAIGDDEVRISPGKETEEDAQTSLKTSPERHTATSPMRHRTVNGPWIPESNPSINRPSIGFQSATDNFRAIIKASASPQTSMENVSPLPPHPEASHSRLTTENQKLKTTSSEIAVKLSPSTASEELRNKLASDSALVQVKLSESQTNSDMQARKTVAVAKARLANPATRGKSLQSVAANTEVFLRENPAEANMPSPPRTRVGLGRPQMADGGGTSKVGTAAVGEETPDGPWSRESFDLFGDCKWQPHNRAQFNLVK